MRYDGYSTNGLRNSDEGADPELIIEFFSVLLLLCCRAVALGLTTDDVMAIEEFTETLKKKRSPYDVSQLKKDAETDELKSRVCIY